MGSLSKSGQIGGLDWPGARMGKLVKSWGTTVHLRANIVRERTIYTPKHKGRCYVQIGHQRDEQFGTSERTATLTANIGIRRPSYAPWPFVSGWEPQVANTTSGALVPSFAAACASDPVGRNSLQNAPGHC